MGYKYNPLIFNGLDLTGSGSITSWKSPVATEAALPTVGNTDGDARVTLDSDYAWVWDATTSRWINIGIKVAVVGSTPNANGYSLEYVDVGLNRRELRLTLQPADATNPGVITTGTQTIAGDKTFNDDVVVQGDFTVNGTTTTINTVNLTVEDSNITINFGGNDASAEGSGLTIDRTGVDGSLVYEDALASKFKAGALGSEIELANVSSVQTLTNKSIDADLNTITNIENADIKVGADIARAKLANGTPDYVLINDPAGVMSEEAQLAVSRGGTGAASFGNNTFIGSNATGSALLSITGITYNIDATNFQSMNVGTTLANTVTNISGIAFSPGLDDINASIYKAFSTNSNIGPNILSQIGDITSFQSSPNLNVLADVGNYTGFDEALASIAGALLDNYTGISVRPTLDHAALTNYKSITIYPNIGQNDPITISDVVDVGLYASYRSNADLGNVRHIDINPSYETGSLVDNIAFLNIAGNLDVVGMNQIQGIIINGNFGANSATDISGYTGIIVSPTFNANAVVSSYNGISLRPRWLTGGSDITNYSTFDIRPEFDVATITSITNLNVGSQLGFTSATAVSNYIDINVGPNIEANAVVDNYVGIHVSPQFNVGSSGTNFAGINISPGNTPTFSNSANGLTVNLNTMILPSGIRSQGINISASSNNLSAEWTPLNALSIDQGNGITALMHVQSGSPLTGTDTILNSLAGLILAEDDIALGPIGIGSSFVGYVGQVAVVATKTVAAVNGAIAGFSFPATSTGGTVTDVSMFRALGAFSAGGTLNITNMYGLKVDAGMTASASNGWGVYVADTAAHNWFAKNVVIGGSTGTSTYELEVNGDALIKETLSLEDPGIGTNRVIIQAPTLGADWTLTLPDNDGAADQVLQTNGSGVTSWATVALPSSGDLNETSFTIINSQTDQNVTGLAFANGSVRSAKIQYSVIINDATDYYEEGELSLVQRGADWTISRTFSGDDSLIDFDVTNAGQVQYTTPAYSTFVSGTMKFRAQVTGV